MKRHSVFQNYIKIHTRLRWIAGTHVGDGKIINIDTYAARIIGAAMSNPDDAAKQVAFHKPRPRVGSFAQLFYSKGGAMVFVDQALKAHEAPNVFAYENGGVLYTLSPISEGTVAENIQSPAFFDEGYKGIEAATFLPQDAVISEVTPIGRGLKSFKAQSPAAGQKGGGNE